MYTHNYIFSVFIGKLHLIFNYLPFIKVQKVYYLHIIPSTNISLVCMRVLATWGPKHSLSNNYPCKYVIMMYILMIHINDCFRGFWLEIIIGCEAPIFKYKLTNYCTDHLQGNQALNLQHCMCCHCRCRLDNHVYYKRLSCFLTQHTVVLHTQGPDCYRIGWTAQFHFHSLLNMRHLKASHPTHHQLKYKCCQYKHIAHWWTSSEFNNAYFELK